MLGGDARHERLGAVSPSDAEQVTTRRNRLSRHLGHVDLLGTAHQEHFRA